MRPNYDEMKYKSIISCFQESISESLEVLLLYAFDKNSTTNALEYIFQFKDEQEQLSGNKKAMNGSVKEAQRERKKQSILLMPVTMPTTT